MAHVVTIPSETDVLCEGCGYVLNGLPPDARCPECGKPADESRSSLRHPPAFESARGRARPFAFLTTTAAVLFRTNRFFRTLPPRSDSNSAKTFARIHWGTASALMGLAAWAHVDWFVTLGGSNQFQELRKFPFLAITCAATYVFIVGANRLAGKLTSWEAGYRGLRLPFSVVLRGLQYHSAHYLPVGVVAAGTVLGYQLLLAHDWITGATGARYLYVLCAEIILAAAYLFSTYWTAMRNLMYANR